MGNMGLAEVKDSTYQMFRQLNDLAIRGQPAVMERLLTTKLYLVKQVLANLSHDSVFLEIDLIQNTPGLELDILYSLTTDVPMVLPFDISVDDVINVILNTMFLCVNVVLEKHRASHCPESFLLQQLEQANVQLLAEHEYGETVCLENLKLFKHAF